MRRRCWFSLLQTGWKMPVCSMAGSRSKKLIEEKQKKGWVILFLWYGYGDDKAGRGYRDPKREYDLLSGHGRRNQGKRF